VNILASTFPEPHAAKCTQAAQASLRCGIRDPGANASALDPGSAFGRPGKWELVVS